MRSEIFLNSKHSIFFSTFFRILNTFFWKIIKFLIEIEKCLQNFSKPNKKTEEAIKSSFSMFIGLLGLWNQKLLESHKRWKFKNQKSFIVVGRKHRIEKALRRFYQWRLSHICLIKISWRSFNGDLYGKAACGKLIWSFVYECPVWLLLICFTWNFTDLKFTFLLADKTPLWPLRRNNICKWQKNATLQLDKIS